MGGKNLSGDIKITVRENCEIESHQQNFL